MRSRPRRPRCRWELGAGRVVARPLLWSGATLLAIGVLSVCSAPAERSAPDETTLEQMRERVERLNTFIDCLNAERRPVPERLTAHEVRERLMAVHLHLARPGVAEPEPAFLRRLERAVRRAVAAERPRHGRV